MTDAPSLPTLRWPPTRQLWTLAGGLGLFAAAATVANFTLASSRPGADFLGQDFMAFYAAGKLALAGRGEELYDLAALAQSQREIADAAGRTMAASVAPWWNPPHVALAFAPLAMLPFKWALLAWTIVGLACLAATGRLLASIVAESSPRRRHRWLAPALLLACPATLQAIGHGQNTLVSLLLLTLVVLGWRARNGIAAGVACAVLCYKPQLAAIVAVGLVATLGWRVLVGLMIGGIPILLGTLHELPGALDAFVERSADNLHQIRFEQAYAWHRHVTTNAFFRHVLQGNAPGETHAWIVALATACTLLMAATLVFAWARSRRSIADGDGDALDRLIALTILATPLLVPFFFDYDLLLLCVAGVLVGREMLESSDVSSTAMWLRRIGAFTFAWTMINPALADVTGFNATVPLLAASFALQARRCIRPTPAAIDEANEHDASTSRDAGTADDSIRVAA